MQLRLLSIFLLMILALGPTACAGPYSNAPDKLARPHLDDDDDDEGDDDDDDEEAEQDKDKDKDKDKAKDVCRTNFFAEPFTGRRDQRRARALSRKIDPVLLKADSTESPEERVPLIVSAVKTLSDALEADPYGPEPTYKLAVAYALGNRKACSLRVLERLAALKAMPDVEREASRIIKRASRDVAFAAFRDEANTALGN